MQPLDHAVARFAETGDADAEEDCHEQHRQDLPTGEGTDESIGDDREQERHQVLLLDLADITADGGRIKGPRIHAHALTRPYNVGHHEADHQGERRHHQEITHRLGGGAAEARQRAHAGNARRDGQEDHRRDDEFDELDECVAERFQRHGEIGREMPQRSADHDRDQHLGV